MATPTDTFECRSGKTVNVGSHALAKLTPYSVRPRAVVIQEIIAGDFGTATLIVKSVTTKRKYNVSDERIVAVFDD